VAVRPAADDPGRLARHGAVRGDGRAGRPDGRLRAGRRACSRPAPAGSPVGCYAVVSTLLLWAALPARPRLRGLRRSLDPVLAPVVLLAAALVTPFVVGEVELQNTSGDEHAHMAHYFDMAWVSVALVLVGALAAVVPAARRRVLWLTGGWCSSAPPGSPSPEPHVVAAGRRPGRRRHPGRARGPPDPVTSRG
jgi:hypothetical protein